MTVVDYRYFDPLPRCPLHIKFKMAVAAGRQLISTLWFRF